MLYYPWTVALDPQSTDLSKMVQEPRARFHVARWGGAFVIRHGYKLALPASSKFTLTKPSTHDSANICVIWWLKGALPNL